MYACGMVLRLVTFCSFEFHPFNAATLVTELYIYNHMLVHLEPREISFLADLLQNALIHFFQFLLTAPDSIALD